VTENPYGGSESGFRPDPNAPAPHTWQEPASPTVQPAQPGYGPAAPQGYGQPAPGYPYPYPPGSGVASPQEKGFFGSLFDFSFTSFVTPKIIKVVYVLEVVFVVLAYVVVTIGALSANGGAGVAVLLFGALGAILYLALLRMVLEFFLGVYRMSQDVRILRSRHGM
jgi:hypothetical protein